MKYIFKFGKTMGLGDTLWYTPIYKAIKDSETFFVKTEQAKKFSFLFDGLTNFNTAEESFFENENHLDYIFNTYGQISKEEYLNLRNYDPIHHCKKIFKIMSIDENKFNIITKINVSENSIIKVQEILNKIGNPSNPIILISNNSGGIFDGKDKNNWQAAYRTFRPDVLQIIINELSKKYTILHCGIKGRVFNFNNVIRIFDYLSEENSIEAITGLYKLVGKYIGIDTGDAHLMLSVGGETKTLIPDRSPFYNGISSVFSDEEFKNEKIRAEYINFNNWQKILEKNKLSF